MPMVILMMMMQALTTIQSLPVHEIRRFDDKQFWYNGMKPADSGMLDHRNLHPKLMNNVNVTSNNCSTSNSAQMSIISIVT